MENILAVELREVLRDFTASDLLLAFDFDGTLAPIVDDASQAQMNRSTRDLMWELTRRYPVIVISGRSQPDALKRLRGVGVRQVLGNHGIEPRHAANRYIERVKRWRPQIEACVAELPGVEIEDKIYSVALHYRHAREPDAARAAILDMSKQLNDVRVVGGKLVLNFLPAGAVDKGSALAREMERLGYSRAIYVGDDETDEDVFIQARPGQWLTIRVGDGISAASYCISDQSAIDDLLRLLVELRPEAGLGSSRQG